MVTEKLSISAILLLVASFVLASCEPTSEQNAADDGGIVESVPIAVSGSVNGGYQPVVNATVSLYKASLNSADAMLIGQGTTDANGSFFVSASGGSCPAGALFYLTAERGNVAYGAPENTAIHMLSFIGDCAELRKPARIDEVSTVTAAYALNRFIRGTDNKNIGGDQARFAKALAILRVIYDKDTRRVMPGLTGTANIATREKINALANSLAECVNSSSGASLPCQLMKQCSAPGSVYSSATHTCSGGSNVPDDTMAAVLSVARNTGQVDATGLYQVAGANGVFTPASSTAPQNWLMNLSYDTGLNAPMNVAIDSMGNAWVVNAGNSTLSVFDINGLIGTTASGANGLVKPLFLAIDNSDQVFVSNSGQASSCLTGKPVSGFYLNGTTPSAMAAPGQWGNVGPCRSFGIATLNKGLLWLVSWMKLDGSNSSGTNDGSRFHFINYLPVSNGGYGAHADEFYTRRAWRPIGVVVNGSDSAWIAEQTGATTGDAGASALDSWRVVNASWNPVHAYYSMTASNYGSSTNNPNPYNITLDPSGRRWFTALSDASVGRFDGARQRNAVPLPYPTGIAVDANGDVWVSGGANPASGTGTGRNRFVDDSDVATASDGRIARLASNGSALHPANGFQVPGIVGGNAAGIAVDDLGNVWVTNATNNTVSILIGAAAPTRTPVSSAIREGFVP